jgi:nucleoside-diphosphate kinase
MERTLVLIKPDAIQRGLAGRVLSRFEDKGLQLAGLRLVQVDEATARQLYAEHEGKDFYQGLVTFITSGPIIAAVVRGVRAIAVVRKLLGSTFGPTAEPGTIRGDFGNSQRYNLVHGSDSEDSARREIALFFDEGDILDSERTLDAWTYSPADG